MKRVYSRRPATLASMAALAAGLAASGQVIAPPPAPAAGAEEPAIVLSPFVANADQDVGYQAANTTAGSRLNTALKDTAAAITPFTKEFLDDLGATTLGDIMEFAGNYEPDHGDDGGFNALASRRADTTNAPFRLRGQIGGVAIDLAETGIPVDFSEIERIEVASGPNSILFGTGATGGLVNLATKRAAVTRSKRMLRTTVGSWSNVRHEVDFNQVLAKNRLAVRLFGVDGNREGWRYWDFEDVRRLTGGVTIKPWSSTTVSGSHGRGRLGRHITQPWNGGDQITLWRAQGSVVTDGPANLGGAGTAVISTVNRFTFVENDGAVYNLRNELASRGYLENVEGEKRLLSGEQMPYEYSFTGPGARYASRFNNTLVRVEQRVGAHLVAEAAYQRNEANNASFAYGMANNMLELQGDPNLSLPLPAGGTTRNSRAGALFMENRWQPETARIANEVYRLTASYDLTLGRWLGQHRFAALAESARLERDRRDGIIILVDQNNVPISNAAAPEGTANFLWRRNYVTEGDFRTYYMSDPRIPLPPVSFGGREYHDRMVHLSEVGTSSDWRDTDALMGALQSFWLDRRVVTTFGYRVDDTVFHETTTARVSPTDPRVASGERVANEWDVVPGTVTKQVRSFRTQSAGAVYHVTRRVSVFYNQSSNVGTPRFDRTVIPGILPPAARGRGRDAGLMLDFLGDERYFARINFFETKQIGDAALAPGGVAVENNYFTRGINTMLDHLEQRGRITQAEYDAHHMAFSAMTIDVASEGVELELVANPTPNWTLRANYSYTDRGRENYFVEREPYLSDALAFIRSRDDRSVMTSGLTIEQAIASLLQEIQDTADANEGLSNGARPAKATFTTRYRWPAGRLKGAYVGGSCVYLSAPLLQVSGGRDIYGNDVRQFNVFAGQAFRLPWRHLLLKAQLNVYNVGNTDVADPGRYNNSLTGLRRVYLREPRSFRLSATVEF